MNVLPIIKKLTGNELNYIPDYQINEGADGQVFTIVGDEDKVLKLSILFGNSNKEVEQKYKNINRICFWRSHKSEPAFVAVEHFGRLGSSIPYSNNHQKFILHYHTMEKLETITEDERKVFHSLLSHEDLNIEKKYSMDQIKKMVNGMAKGLDFNRDEVILFVGNLRKSDIIQPDLHPRNIMKNKAGKFKVIDLDRCILKFNNKKD